MPPGARPGVPLAGRAAHAGIGCAICHTTGLDSRAASGPDAGSVGRGAAFGGARRGPGRRRTCDLPVKSRELCLLSYGAETEGEGVEPPSPRGPPVFETGYRAGGSPSSGRDASESRPTKMWPAGIEPAAPRVSGGRSTG